MGCLAARAKVCAAAALAGRLVGRAPFIQSITSRAADDACSLFSDRQMSKVSTIAVSLAIAI